MANPDIKLLIGPKGEASPSGASAVEIRRALQSALSGKNGVKVDVRLTSNAANNLRQEIQKALNANGGINVKIKGQIAGAMSKGTSGSGGGKQKPRELSEIDSAYKALTAIEKRIRELQVNKIKLDPEVDAGQIATIEKEISAAAQRQTELNAKAEELKGKYPQIVEQSKAYANYQAKSVENASKLAIEEAKAADASKRAADNKKKAASTAAQAASSVKSTALLNEQNFEKYLQGVSAKGRMAYSAQINGIREFYRVAHDTGLQEDLKKADSAAREFRATMKETGLEAGNVFTYIQNKAKSFMVYLVSSKLTNALIKGVRDGVTAVKELNAELTQLRIVTGASQNQMDKFLDSAIAKSKNVGSSVTDMLNSTTVYARLGYSMNESADLAEYTAMLQNVGDIDVASAQNAITAIVKAYDVGANQIEATMDKMVTVGNNFPISVSQLAEGMNNAGSALSAAGNSFDQSLALLAAANTTVQNISKSSTGLRTIAARIRNTKTELDDLGEAMTDAEYDNLVQSLTKANVSLTDTKGELRSTYDILQDVAKVWGDMTNNDQAALAETLAGTRQQNIFYSLINQFNEASKAMGAMTSSAGAMSSANSVYMESVGAKADRMKASFQELASTLLDSDIVGLLYDIGNGALNAVSAFDAWPAKIALVAAGLPTLIGLFRELRHMPLIESIGGSFKDLARPKMTGRNWNWANHLEEAA